MQWGVALAVAATLGALAWHFADRIPAIAAERLSPREPAVFSVLFLRLLSGLSTYVFLSGGDPGSWTSVADGLVILLAVGTAAALGARYREVREWPVAALLLGLPLAVAAFYAVAGTYGVTPHFERYALWAIAPLTLAMSLAWRWCHDRAQGWLRPACGATPLIVAGLLLWSFCELYFRPFLQDGGNSHLAFRTAAREPKSAALEYITRETPEPLRPLIVSRNWWTRWAIEYAALARPGRIEFVAPADLQALPPWDPKRTWFVELSGTDEERAAASYLTQSGHTIRRTYTRDRAGRPVVTVLRQVDRSESP